MSLSSAPNSLGVVKLRERGRNGDAVCGLPLDCECCCVLLLRSDACCVLDCALMCACRSHSVADDDPAKHEPAKNAALSFEPKCEPLALVGMLEPTVMLDPLRNCLHESLRSTAHDRLLALAIGTVVCRVVATLLI